jgi:hypothetical protein
MAEDEMSLLTLDKICTDTDARDQAACVNMLSGFMAGLQKGQATARQGKPICFPKTVSMEQMKLIIDNFVHDSPENVHYPAFDALPVVLQHVIPCPPSQK